MLVDLAVMLADGGEAIADITALANQPALHGPVASPATAWRVLAGIDQARLVLSPGSPSWSVACARRMGRRTQDARSAGLPA